MLRLSELYSSVQGEGHNVGAPTQFVRFAGCNLRCPGWPCDTPFAIDPAIWKTQSEKITALDLLNRLPRYPRNLCLTGGEPFAQPDIELHEFCEMAWEHGYSLEMFTNGTKLIPKWAQPIIRFMMDWKLTGSGEDMSAHEDVRRENVRILLPTDGVKFVVKDERDMHEALLVHRELTTRPLNACAQFWVTPVWDKYDPQSIVEFVQEHELPWRLSLQQHKYIWSPEMRSV